MLLLEAAIGTVQTSEVDEKFYELAEACKKDGEVKMTVLGNGHKFELFSKDNKLCEDGKLLVTANLISDRYTRSLYIS